MKLNLNKTLVDFKGKEAIKVVNGKEQKQFLRDMVSEALYAAGMNPQLGMDMAKKLVIQYLKYLYGHCMMCCLCCCSEK